MNGADRRRHLEQLRRAALERSAADRPSFLSTVCGDDAALRHDVESLLSNGSDDAERYRVGHEVAHGGMGSIHVAEDLRLSRTVAVKRLLAQGAGARARFQREALITASLQHPAVVPVFDFGELPARAPYYAMKLVDGMTLDRAIAQAGTVEARLSILPHVATVIDAMAYAHSRGIVHRDLKPGNVLVGAFGETVVIDWGLAKDMRTADDTLAIDAAQGDENVTRVGTVMGTPSYMPPEQAVGASVDARADVYALGAMLYHLLAGRSPYPSRPADDVLADVVARPPVPLRQLEPSLPIDLVTIVEKAMAREPSLRYPTAVEMAADLRRFQTGQLVGAHHYTTWQLARRLVAKNPTAIALAGLIVIAVAFALAVVVVRQLHLQERRETKRVTDAEIRALETAMAQAHDPADLLTLDRQLEDAVQRARAAAEELAGPAAPVALGNDDLDRRIHAVLARLDDDTYSIPPLFRDDVVRSLRLAESRGALDTIRRNKRTLWPVITRELEAFGLPDALGYVAWFESRMNPSATGPAGSVGLWQFGAETARNYGLRVDGSVDERLDPVKSSRAAAHLFADRFAEFGSSATLLAIVSYNQGASSMRQLLHAVALEKGSWRSGRRSYWHLYRTRRFSREAEGYIPQIVGAALLDDSTR